MFCTMVPVLLEPSLLPAPPAPGAGLKAPPPLQRPAAGGRGPVGLRPTTVSVLLHLLLLLLIVFGLPDWMLHQPVAPPPAIEVALVLPPPPPPAPPAPKAKPPEPPPTVPLSSDAQSTGPTPPRPADKAEAAPAAPEPGPPAAPPRKPEPPTPAPAAKPAPAAGQRAPTPPTPRSTVGAPQTAPGSSKPAPSHETQTATVAPEPAPTPRGAKPVEPDTGKAPQTGYGVAMADPPGGIDPAVFDPYLAAVRDKIITRRDLLRTFQWSHERIVMWLILDDKGRLRDFGVAQSNGSVSFENSVRNMLAMAPYFGPPPPGLIGKTLLFYLAIPETQADWDEFMAKGRPPGSSG